MQFLRLIFSKMARSNFLRFFGLKGMGPKFFMALVMGREGKGREGKGWMAVQCKRVMIREGKGQQGKK